MNDAPTVTVLIPARDEAADIAECLRAVLAQDHPHDRMEIVLVDGGSTDGTAAQARRLLEAGTAEWKVLENPTGTTPSNLNVGLRAASGDIVCRVDARSIIPPDYVRTCAATLTARPEIAVTGGAQVARPAGRSRQAQGIARALNNRLAMGGSRYRAGAASGPSDTVYLGVFRTDDLRRVGGWDEVMQTNQDFDLNRRMSRLGVVWFDGELSVGYVPRRSLGSLWQQYHRFGRWKVRYWRHSGDRPQPRQLAVIGGAALAVGAATVMMTSARGRVVLVVGVPAGLALVDRLGSTQRAEDASVRLFAMAAVATTGGAWLSGLLCEAVVGDRT